MNEKLMVGIGVGVLSVVWGATVFRATAQSTPAAGIPGSSVGNTVMRMHCNSCKVVRPETVEAPVVLEPQRYWRGQLPVPDGYTHWVPPVDDYERHAPELAVNPLPEILRGSSDGIGSGLTPGGNMGAPWGRFYIGDGGPSLDSDELERRREEASNWRQRKLDQDEKKKQDDINNMLNDYRQNKNKR